VHHSIDRPSTPGQSRPIDVRPLLSVFTPPPDDPPPHHRQPEAFDAIPQRFHDDIAAGWLPKSAAGVLAAHLRLAFAAEQSGFGDGHSCWASNKAIAMMVGLKSERQVRNIRGAIEERGWLRRDDQVGPSDPIDPRNRTGERWHFAWKTGEMPPRDPAEVAPGRGAVGRPSGSRKLISSPPLAPSEAPEPAPPPESNFPESGKFVSPKVDGNSRREETTTDSPRAREADDVGSSSSSRDLEGELSESDAAARASLIASIDRIAPEAENPEVRRPLLYASRDMLKTAELAGSPSRFDHVRMAIEKAAESPKRRDTIESFARGVLNNWAREGFPAINAPVPPGRPKPPPDLDAERLAYVERRRADEAVEARKQAQRDRWDRLSEADKDALWAEFERENPRNQGALKFWESHRRLWCLERMGVEIA
jgi:hypothetical protein